MALASTRLADSLTYLKKSVAIDASYSDGYNQIGDQIADFDPDRAIAFYRHALVLDPRMAANRGDIVTTLAAAGRADDATRELDTAASSPGAFPAMGFRIGLALDERRFDVALRLLTDGGWWRKSQASGLQYANALRAGGHADEARAVAGTLARRIATTARLAPRSRRLISSAVRRRRLDNWLLTH